MLAWLSKRLIVAVCYVLPNLGVWLLSNWQEILDICWFLFSIVEEVKKLMSSMLLTKCRFNGEETTTYTA